jgi:hypothetical protein
MRSKTLALLFLAVLVPIILIVGNSSRAYGSQAFPPCPSQKLLLVRRLPEFGAARGAPASRLHAAAFQGFYGYEPYLYYYGPAPIRTPMRMAICLLTIPLTVWVIAPGSKRAGLTMS